MTSQRVRTVPEMTHAQPWLPSPTADPHSHDCYMNTSYSMRNTQSRLPVNDNDVVTSIATFGTFEAVVFFSFCLSLVFHGMGIPYLSPAVFGEHSTVQFPLIYLLHWRNVLMETLSVFMTHCTKILREKDKCEWRNCICSKMLQPNIWYFWKSLFRNSS